MFSPLTNVHCGVEAQNLWKPTSQGYCRLNCLLLIRAIIAIDGHHEKVTDLGKPNVLTAQVTFIFQDEWLERKAWLCATQHETINTP